MRAIDPNPTNGPMLVIPHDTSRSHWMPDPARGFCTAIVSPSDLPMIHNKMGVQQFEPGEALPERYHDLHEELLCVIDGGGVARLDGTEYRLEKGATIFVGRNVAHSLVNDGATPLVWLWMMIRRASLMCCTASARRASAARRVPITCRVRPSRTR